MTDRLEALIREAGNWTLPPLDTTAVAARARQRRRHRGAGLAVALVTVLAVTAGLAVAVWPDNTDEVVSTTGRAPEVTWTPVSLPAVAGGQGPSIAGGADEGLIAVGNTGTQDRPTEPPPVPTIWHSTDGGSTWSVVYTDPAVVTDPEGILQRPAASFGTAHYVNGTFVVVGTVNLQGAETSIAGIWTSPDGTTWTKADDTAFRSPVAENASGSESRILAVGGWQSRLVAIGDLYVDAPKKTQCCGLGVGAWTSRDGITWKRSVADLGDGFDPYIWSLTTHGSDLLGGGSVDIRTGSVWMTRDLRTWNRSTIADNGLGKVLRIGDDYITVGGQPTGPQPKKHETIEPADETGIPTIWWSDNATDWTKTFTLPERARGKNTADTSFTDGATVPGLALAVGPAEATSTTRSNSLYASTNGHRWARLAVPGESSNTLATIVGTDDTGIYVSRYAQGSQSRLAQPVTVWRVAPVERHPASELTVTALPVLRFDAQTYEVPAGKVDLTSASAGGTHELRFDKPSLRRVRLRATEALSSTARVRLEPGRYTIYCDIPGHRAAGMEATIIAN